MGLLRKLVAAIGFGLTTETAQAQWSQHPYGIGGWQSLNTPFMHPLYGYGPGSGFYYYY